MKIPKRLKEFFSLLGNPTRYVLMRRKNGRHSIFHKGDVPGCYLISDEQVHNEVVDRLIKDGIDIAEDFNEGLDRGFFKRL